MATALWGFAFVATVWVLEFLDAPYIIFYRFLLSTAVGIVPVFFLWKKWQLSFPFLWTELKLSFWPGVWLFATLALQTFGLMTTTASKSAFITVLYVILIPFISAGLGKDKLKAAHILCVFLALFGLALFQDLKLDSWSIGDTLTVFAALAACLHILSVNDTTHRTANQYLLNLGQGLVTTFLAILLFPLGTRSDLFSMNEQAWWGMLALSVGAGLIAFYLQVRAQEKIKPNLASLLFLLESPFSAVFAFWLLSETFSVMQLSGVVLILAACAGAIFSSSPKTGYH